VTNFDKGKPICLDPVPTEKSTAHAEFTINGPREGAILFVCLADWPTTVCNNQSPLHVFRSIDYSSSDSMHKRRKSSTDRRGVSHNQSFERGVITHTGVVWVQSSEHKCPCVCVCRSKQGETHISQSLPKVCDFHCGCGLQSGELVF
jgi:hypothetical protein